MKLRIYRYWCYYIDPHDPAPVFIQKDVMQWEDDNGVWCDVPLVVDSTPLTLEKKRAILPKDQHWRLNY